ncbi:MAG: type II toxin-antitoxin system RelB/DinJ family antitoxin [Burkholderiales bacterium]
MALSTEIRCRIDQELKDDAQKVLDHLGLSISHAIRIFLRQVVRSGGLPFDMKAPPQVREPRATYTVKIKKPSKRKRVRSKS